MKTTVKVAMNVDIELVAETLSENIKKPFPSNEELIEAYTEILNDTFEDEYETFEFKFNSMNVDVVESEEE